MSPYECYVDYLALKRHFTTESYDYFKYNGKVSAKQDSFQKRKDKFFFEKISRHRDPHEFIISNLIKNPRAWVRDIAYSDVAESNYQDWIKKKQSLSYIISNELSHLHDDFDSNFKVLDGQIPHIIALYLGNKISLETVLICVDILGCLPYWNKVLKDNIIWTDMGMLIRKALPFIKYDKSKIKKIFIDKFS
jgi:hypothetical protein